MTLFGGDMSHFDQPDPGTAVAEGIAFLTHKAGGDKDDPEIGVWWSHVRAYDPAAVLLGAYWVLYPGQASARADAFLARLDATCPGWRDRPFILQVDCEKWGGDPATVPSKADIKAFCDRLVSQMPRLRPIVYAPEWVYGNKLAGLGYPLWASSYVVGAGTPAALYPGDTSSRWGPYSGQTPAILQFTSSARIGGQTTCDANAYRGTLDQLKALVAPGWTDMDLTQQNLKDIATAVWATDDIIAAPAGTMGADGKPNQYLTAKDYLTRIYNQGVAESAADATNQKALLAAITAGKVDVSLLASQLAGPLAAALPDSVTADDVYGAFQKAFGPAES